VRTGIETYKKWLANDGPLSAAAHGRRMAESVKVALLRMVDANSMAECLRPIIQGLFRLNRLNVSDKLHAQGCSPRGKLTEKRKRRARLCGTSRTKEATSAFAKASTADARGTES
jgi:hypothetical protein